MSNSGKPENIMIWVCNLYFADIEDGSYLEKFSASNI
jgi:hypothetical protein